MSDNEVSIKNELYSSFSTPGTSPSSLSLKHQLLDHFADTASKRQRVISENTQTNSPDLTTILTDVSACLPQKHVSSKREAQISSGVEQIKDNALCEDNEITSDPLTYLRILSLPVLESLATQIISLLSRKNFHDIVTIVNTPESELGKVYLTLKSLFNQVKKIYSPQALFLSTGALGIKEPELREIIRISNLATFVCTVFDGHGVGFLDLNDNFIEIFTVEGNPLSKEAGDLFLNLKTQIYLSAVSQEEQERTREDILEEFFPNDLDEILKKRHPSQPLSQSEYEFTQSLITRREFLANSPIDLDSIQALSENFSWGRFLNQISGYLGRETLLAVYMKRYGLNAPLPVSISHNTEQLQPVIEDDLGLQVELAAKQTLESLGLNSSQMKYERIVHEDQYTINCGSYHPDCSSINLPIEQTAPTQVLYERARYAAVAKASPSNTRRPGLPSQRRPWSSEEERALMSGLDQVKGPHWSQILALYGAKGTINEVLKDRNQVQLKDKARNLKLFFLKSGIEVPYHLKTVTGELKTRAPTQAAKREAEERARLADIDDQSNVEQVESTIGTTDNLDSMLSLSMTRNYFDCSQEGSDKSGLKFTKSVLEPKNQTEDQQLILGIVDAPNNLTTKSPAQAINMSSMTV